MSVTVQREIGLAPVDCLGKEERTEEGIDFETFVLQRLGHRQIMRNGHAQICAADTFEPFEEPVGR